MRSVDSCADLGDGVHLLWEEQVPEGDPGIVLVAAEQRGNEVVSALVSGPAITGDPRDLDLVAVGRRP